MSLRERYLAELGLDASPPSVEALRELHRAHAQRFAHDSVWVARRRIPAFGQESLAEALVAGEGGGCLQLNLGFAWLLEELGYVVRHHHALTQFAFDQVLHEGAVEHVVLTVELDGETWYADVGLGNGMLDPVPFVEHTFTQEGAFTYGLERHPDLARTWRFRHDRRLMAVQLCQFTDEEAEDLEVYARGYAEAHSSPESPFVRILSANRRREDGVSSLTGTVLIRRGTGGRSMTHLSSAEELEQVLREEFLLALPGWTGEERDRLWRAVSTRA